MRLWHKDLVPVLPRKQLLSQWRECCAIASNIVNKGTPNHILVNKVLCYPIDNFNAYCKMVMMEMSRRGYIVSESVVTILFNNIETIRDRLGYTATKQPEVLFEDWHNERYFWQCYFNLQEKYDCDGITKEEWLPIEEKATDRLSNKVNT